MFTHHDGHDRRTCARQAEQEVEHEELLAEGRSHLCSGCTPRHAGYVAGGPGGDGREWCSIYAVTLRGHLAWLCKRAPL